MDGTEVTFAESMKESADAFRGIAGNFAKLEKTTRLWKWVEYTLVVIYAVMSISSILKGEYLPWLPFVWVLFSAIFLFFALENRKMQKRSREQKDNLNLLADSLEESGGDVQKLAQALEASRRE